MACDKRCDLNNDGVVDSKDNAIFTTAYNSKRGDPNWNSACDFNGNGEVDFDDFSHFASNMGCTFSTPTPTPTPTPPPANITCNGATPHYSSGCALLNHYDADDDGVIGGHEIIDATIARRSHIITNDEYDFVSRAHNAGSINAVCAGCYTGSGTPTPPPKICTPGSTRCYNKRIIETCNSDGTKWVSKNCQSNHECRNGVCVYIAPTPTPTPTPDCPWDLNGDGVVDSRDKAIFEAAYNSKRGDSNWNQACDFNGDGKVDFIDFSTFSAHFGTCPGVTPTPTPTPTPAPTPTPTPGNQTITKTLPEGNHSIRVQLSGYAPFSAVIKVTPSRVLCVSVDSGACGGSGLPRLSTSGWNVTINLKEGTSGSGYAEWLSSKDGLNNVTLSDIFELKDAFIGLTDIGFTPTLPQIMECKDAFIGL